MCFYTKRQISIMFGISEATLYRRIKAIKFKKKSKGSLLTHDETQQLASKLGIKVSLSNSI